MRKNMTDAAQPQMTRVRIWDRATRLFHWALVTLVLLLYLTAEYEVPTLHLPAWAPGGARDIANMTLHIWCGYGVLTLLLFRLAWGVVGSSTARFTTFVRGPAAMLAYGRSLLSAKAHFVGGHNPLGAAMVVAMILVLSVQAVTGLFTKDEDDYFGVAVGPLNSLVSDNVGLSLTSLHHYNFILVEWLVIIHILANLYYWLVRRDNLIAPMFTGTKMLPTALDVRFAPGMLALGVFVAAALIVWAVVTLLPR